MHIDVIDRWTDFDSVRGNWEAVYKGDPEAQFFLTWQWLHDWLSVYQTPWLILAAKRRDTDGEYVAFLPLRLLTEFDEAQGFLHELQFAGTGFSDYGGILSLPQDESEAIPALAEYVKQEIRWARFTMHNMTMSDARRRLFLTAFADGEFIHTPIEYRNPGEATNHGVCLSIDLPRQWEDYLATLSANNRQKIRRLLRKVDAMEACHIASSDSKTFEQNLTILLELWKLKWAPSKGVDNADEIARLNHAMLARCAENGTLLLPVFRDGDRPVAALAILIDRCKKSLLFFIAGRDENYREMPAGYLLHAYSIRHAIANGFETYDFLKGNEPYKYLFAPQQERQQQAVAVATRTGGNMAGKLDPRALTVVVGMTAELHDRGEMADAERGYRQILDVAPNHALALYRFGRLMADLGNHAQAKALLSRSVTVEPDGDNAWLWLARSLQWLGERKAARAACEEAISLQPENADAWKLLIELCASTEVATAANWPNASAGCGPATSAEPDRRVQQHAQDIHDQIREYLDAYMTAGSR